MTPGRTCRYPCACSPWCILAKKRRRISMSLSLGFPESPQEVAVSPKPSLEAPVARFRDAHGEPDSPVRAVHHQPAAEGIYVALPESIDSRLKSALASRGITRLYSHQAE